MRLRQAALPAALIVLLIASVALVIKTSRQPELSVDDAQLAAARAAHQRRESARVSAPRAPPPAPCARTPRTEAPPATPPREPEREPPRRERAELERSRPTLSQQATSSSSGDVDIDDVRQPFDRGEFLEALEMAEAYLERDPDQAYVRRIAVTSACAVGQIDTARRFYDQMDERDQRTSEQRCSRWGVEF
jgi:hypothetical protein